MSAKLSTTVGEEINATIMENNEFENGGKIALVAILGSSGLPKV